jgi:hypothetical protein
LLVIDHCRQSEFGIVDGRTFNGVVFSVTFGIVDEMSPKLIVFTTGLIEQPPTAPEDGELWFDDLRKAGVPV